MARACATAPSANRQDERSLRIAQFFLYRGLFLPRAGWIPISLWNCRLPTASNSFRAVLCRDEFCA